MLIYYFQSKDSIAQEKKDREEKNRSAIEYLKIAIRVTIKDLNEYINELENYVKEIEADPSKISSYNSISLSYVEKLYNKSDQNELLLALRSYFQSNEAIKLFTFIFSSVDYLFSALPMVTRQQDIAIQKDLEKRIEYRKVAEAFIDNVALFQTRYKTNMDAVFNEYITRSLLEFYKGVQEDNTISYYQKMIIEKIPKFLTEKYSHIPELLHYAVEGSKSTRVLHDIIAANSSHGMHVKKFINEFRSVTIRLEYVSKEISKISKD